MQVRLTNVTDLSQCIFENTLLTTTALFRIRPPPHYSHETREDLTATQY